jgi:hypothetical protein
VDDSGSSLTGPRWPVHAAKERGGPRGPNSPGPPLDPDPVSGKLDPRPACSVLGTRARRSGVTPRARVAAGEHHLADRGRPRRGCGAPDFVGRSWPARCGESSNNAASGERRCRPGRRRWRPINVVVGLERAGRPCVRPGCTSTGPFPDGLTRREVAMPSPAGFASACGRIAGLLCYSRSCPAATSRPRAAAPSPSSGGDHVHHGYVDRANRGDHRRCGAGR